MKKPRYEVGEQKGAEFCAECHEEIYEEWKNNSRHSVATTAASFHEFKEMFTDVFMFRKMMGGEEMCYACHGIKEVNEGVNCETCHGLVMPEVEIEETHEKKYTPGRKSMAKPDFCPKCHTMKNPMSGTPLMGTYDEWKSSPAAAKGVTCQDCHMKPRESGLRYHGFDTATRNVKIYSGDLNIKDIKLDFPEFSMAIENRVTGHAVPAGGGTRTLALEVTFMDEEGKEIHKIIETFAKVYSLMPILGLMPYKLVKNTQLKSGETRKLLFTLPPGIRDRLNQAVLILRFYEVSDEHEGDIKKAGWVSEPFYEERMNFQTGLKELELIGK